MVTDPSFSPSQAIPHPALRFTPNSSMNQSRESWENILCHCNGFRAYLEIPGTSKISFRMVCNNRRPLIFFRCRKGEIASLFEFPSVAVDIQNVQCCPWLSQHAFLSIADCANLIKTKNLSRHEPTATMSWGMVSPSMGTLARNLEMKTYNQLREVSMS